MKDTDSTKKGWQFAVSLVGLNAGTDIGIDFVNAVDTAIEQLEDSINNHTYRTQDIAHFQGYVQEAWHAGTFNVNAVAADSVDRARMLGSNEKWSVDLALDSGKNYSAKSYASGEKSGIAQVAFDHESGKSGYYQQGRLMPTDHTDDAKQILERRAAKNALTRPDIADAYREAASEITDRLQNAEGIESNTATRKQLDEFAKQGKESRFSADDAGISLESVIKKDYIIREALNAGYTSAAITVAMQLAPEIYKSIDYLIKNGEIDINRIGIMGEKAISGGAEGFLRGSISCMLLIKCKQGVFGEALRAVDSTVLGATVAIVVQTIKNSILVAAGKMNANQMGGAFIDSVVITGGYLVGAHIGGVIGQAIGFELPVLGYLLGSLVGTSFAVVYNIGKKKLISFCVDSGFTCFGLVEQNYELPEEILHKMGIHTIPIPRTNIDRSNVNLIETKSEIDISHYETIDISVLRRGVIGVNKVGYVFS